MDYAEAGMSESFVLGYRCGYLKARTVPDYRAEAFEASDDYRCGEIEGVLDAHVDNAFEVK
jgi:hypothetical protein